MKTLLFTFCSCEQNGHSLFWFYDCIHEFRSHPVWTRKLIRCPSDLVQYEKQKHLEVSLHSLSAYMKCWQQLCCEVFGSHVISFCSQFVVSKLCQIHSRHAKCTLLGTFERFNIVLVLFQWALQVSWSSYFSIDWVFSCHIRISPQWHKHMNNPSFLSLCQ